MSSALGSTSSIPAVGAVDAGTIATVVQLLGDEGFWGRLTIVGPRAGEIVLEYGELVAVSIANAPKIFSSRAEQVDYLFGATDGWYRIAGDKGTKGPQTLVAQQPSESPLGVATPTSKAAAPAREIDTPARSTDSGMFFISSSPNELRTSGAVTLTASDWKALEAFFQPVHSELLPDHQRNAIAVLIQRGLLRFELDGARVQSASQVPAQTAVSSSLLDALRSSLSQPVEIQPVVSAPSPMGPTSPGRVQSQVSPVGPTEPDRVSSLRRLVGSLRRER
jgi:hypothetical protein